MILTALTTCNSQQSSVFHSNHVIDCTLVYAYMCVNTRDLENHGMLQKIGVPKEPLCDLNPDLLW